MFVKKRGLVALYTVAVFGAVFFMHHASASAATIAVGGSCTIDDAVASANADANSGSCTGSGSYGADTITLPAGTITLSNQLILTDDTVISGAGQNQTTLDGSGAVNGPYCDGSSGKNALEVSGLKITGVPQGAIGVNFCDLAISNVELENITGGAVIGNFSQAGDTYSLTINNLYIHNSTMAAAIAVVADASNVAGGITINTSINGLTMSNNTPLNPNPYLIGVLLNDKFGDNNTFATSITNSTLANGPDSVAISSYTGETGSGSLTMRNNTIVGNQPPAGNYGGALTMTGGDGSSMVAFLQNNLFADNGITCYMGNSVGGSIGVSSNGNNLADDTSCGLEAGGDQQNVSSLTSTLGPLQDNGGQTPTMALLAGSPAIDAGATVLGLSTDQRGLARPQGSAYDIGAFELAQTGGGVNANNGGSDDSAQNASNGSGGGLAETGAHVVSPILLVIILATTTLAAAWVLRKRHQYRLASR